MVDKIWSSHNLEVFDPQQVAPGSTVFVSPRRAALFIVKSHS